MVTRAITYLVTDKLLESIFPLLPWIDIYCHSPHVIDTNPEIVVEIYFYNYIRHICLTSVTRVKCGVCSTLCWKIGNVSGSTELFGLKFVDSNLKLPNLSIHTLVMLQK